MVVSSHRLAARMSASQADDRGSSPRESGCPHCHEPFPSPGDEIILTDGRPIGPGDFTVCLSCREIIRFDNQLHLVRLKDQDWSELFRQKCLLTAMLQWRMRLLTNHLKEQRRP